MHRLPSNPGFTRIALVAIRPLGLAGTFLGISALLGYLTSTEILFRPFAGGPATHPLTALLAVLLGAAVLLRHHAHRSRLTPWCAGFAIAVAALRLLEQLLGADILGAITPFQATLREQAALGRPVSMGWNTAAMYLLIGLAVLTTRRPILSQGFASLAVALPLVAITGYAYGLTGFYGQMALTTVAMGFPLAWAALLLTANRGVVRSVLSPYIGGSVARLQIFLSYFGPFLIGLVLVRITSSSAHSLFGLFVVVTSWYLVWIIVVSAVMQDRLDRKRRIAERRLEYAATHDPLTGLVNRRLFLELAEGERVRAQRSGLPIALLMLDIDHFKRINDQAGHGAGDTTLKQVARAIRRQVRRPDVAARLGGEEFAVLLPETPPEAAYQVAERIRHAITTAAYPDIPPDISKVTVSIGCVSSVNDAAAIDELLHQADAALYRAKTSGRNRTEAAAPAAMPATITST